MDRSLSLVALTFAVGCGSLPAPDTQSFDMASSSSSLDPLAALEAETGHAWTVRYHDDPHTPALLEGRTGPLASTAKDALRVGRQFIKNHRALFSMGAGDDLETLDGDTDELEMSHAHFQEVVQSYPVWGGELLAHFASDGALVRINGRYVPITDELPPAVMTSDAARVAAVDAARAANPTLDANAFTTAAPKLYVYPLDGGSAKLAWRVQVDVVDALPQSLETFVDASADDGSIVHVSDTIAFLQGSGVGVHGERHLLDVAQHGATSYWLEDGSRGSPASHTSSAAGGSVAAGDVVKSKDPSIWDESALGAGAAVDAHAFVAATWDHFATVLGRAGFDGSGKGVYATVHFGQQLDSAFFDGKQLVFGDGDGVTTWPLSAGLDLVAHEFTHGVLAHTARLGSEGQSGALAEAIADIFASFIDGNWTIGEDVGIAGPLRDLTNPHATNCAATMSEFTSDNDVHTNSTIVSHAAWLMTQGTFDAPTLEKIWYRALTRYLYSSADFADAADATLAAARDLTPDGESEIRAAWVAAGVVSQ